MGYKIKKQLKKGFKTSELYVTLAALGTLVWGFAQTNCDLSSDKLLALATALVGAAYTGGRIYLKNK